MDASGRARSPPAAVLGDMNAVDITECPTPTARLGGEIVSTQALTKTYGDHRVVDGIDLAVPAGGIYGFLGPNGAGKSTTLKLLLGLIRPTSGTVTVLGHTMTTSRPAAGMIGSLIEGPSFYPSLTGRENLAMVADYLGLPKSAVDRVLDTVGLRGQDAKLAKRYSLGMKQRLGLAMALLPDPPLLLLDEPTNGLDPAGVAEIRQLIVALARQEGRTVLVSSHILSEIEQMADRVGIICAGSLRYQGPLSGLQDAGVTEFTVSDPAGAAQLLTEHRLACEISGRTVRTPELSESTVAELVARLVFAGQSLFGVTTVRTSLEDAFLELTASPGVTGSLR